MPPKKFQNLDDFLDHQPKDPNMVPSPFGGVFNKTTNYQQQRTLNKQGQYPKSHNHQQNWNQGTNYQQGGYQNNYQAGAYQQGGYQNYNQAGAYQNNTVPVSSYKQSTVTPTQSGTPTPSASSTSLTSLNNKLADLALTPVSLILTKIPECANITECKAQIKLVIEQFQNVESETGNSSTKIEASLEYYRCAR